MSYVSRVWSATWTVHVQPRIQSDDTTVMAESEEELKSFLIKVKKESENVGLMLNIQKTKIIASGPITSWKINGETMETVTDFIFLGSKITAVGDCSHEIKRCLQKDQRNRKESPEIDLYKYSQLIFDKGTKAIQWRMVFSTDADGTTGPTQAKNESRYRHYTRPPEDNSKRITGLHVKCKTIIHWENNTQEHADDLGLIMTF